MAYQTVFERYELKYLITQEQKEKVVQAMLPHMAPDTYGRTTIRNIYFDTDSYRLARHSIERPAYKEKLRIRSYKKADTHSTVFVELKKKYDSVVYKRRLSLEEQEALQWVSGETQCPRENQISDEIDYFLDYYKTLHPVVFLSYDREAFFEKDGGDFRVTFDDHILCRRDRLSLEENVWGTPLLPEGMVLMELKCSGAVPLWMTQALSREHIYKTSFSKYGTAYETMIFPNLKGDLHYV